MALCPACRTDCDDNGYSVCTVKSGLRLGVLEERESIASFTYKIERYNTFSEHNLLSTSSKFPATFQILIKMQSLQLETAFSYTS